ncbi:hypothetical protein GGS23DRAFT_541689 [Durotheca rogersii]|uniref:uncharacterized protein n=1 Tax=Durotheca rogersii TaxID=419775 RepID=UPI00221F5E93|nr:uncharacterized protein GGS23DRAFT_541689 [Durotheca rogersii]KAI5852053.1 hypothetical protein GGS23DRAFT_541689 [Durotheca rogersii]
MAPSILIIREVEAKHRVWDVSGISKERQVGLIRVFGFHIRPSGVDEGAEKGVVSQPRALPPRQPKDFLPYMRWQNHEACYTGGYYSQTYSIVRTDTRRHRNTQCSAQNDPRERLLR